ncbi:MAG: 16S rRNA (cytidine(1402)-2'-O)-methyltransferase [Clostridia bacterium]|nr:16S rRNA (cytidine(1402)-2'-O)-methyltransferase [Clostridia bacterium]
MEGPALYIVATPIGNLGDFSPRAVEILREADFIAAEDTRVTQKLLAKFDIAKPMVSYYAHNLRGRGEELLGRLRAGACCALVSDAGTPAISDPGEVIVAQCRAEGIPVYTVPGPCAAVSALAISGLPTGRFSFEGFLSAKAGERRAALAELAAERRTMIFYEAPHKLRSTLSDMAAAFGAERRIFLGRELTKLHEEGILTTLGEAVARYGENEPRGEFVLCVEGAAPEEKKVLTAEEASRELSGEQSARDNVRAAREKGLSRNEAYRAALLAKRAAEQAEG